MGSDEDELSFRRGEVFHVLDTMNGGTIGSWRAQRVLPSGAETEVGIIPNKCRYCALKFKAWGNYKTSKNIVCCQSFSRFPKLGNIFVRNYRICCSRCSFVQLTMFLLLDTLELCGQTRRHCFLKNDIPKFVWKHFCFPASNFFPRWVNWET